MWHNDRELRDTVVMLSQLYLLLKLFKRDCDKLHELQGRGGRTSNKCFDEVRFPRGAISEKHT